MKLNQNDISKMYESDDDEELQPNSRIVKQIAKEALRSREEANILSQKRHENSEYGTRSGSKKRPRY